MNRRQKKSDTESSDVELAAGPSNLTMERKGIPTDMKKTPVVTPVRETTAKGYYEVNNPKSILTDKEKKSETLSKNIDSAAKEQIARVESARARIAKLRSWRVPITVKPPWLEKQRAELEKEAEAKQNRRNFLQTAAIFPASADSPTDAATHAATNNKTDEKPADTAKNSPVPADIMRELRYKTQAIAHPEQYMNLSKTTFEKEHAQNKKGAVKKVPIHTPPDSEDDMPRGAQHFRLAAGIDKPPPKELKTKWDKLFPVLEDLSDTSEEKDNSARSAETPHVSVKNEVKIAITADESCEHVAAAELETAATGFASSQSLKAGAETAGESAASASGSTNFAEPLKSEKPKKSKSSKRKSKKRSDLFKKLFYTSELLLSSSDDSGETLDDMPTLFTGDLGVPLSRETLLNYTYNTEKDFTQEKRETGGTKTKKDSRDEEKSEEQTEQETTTESDAKDENEYVSTSNEFLQEWEFLRHFSGVGYIGIDGTIIAERPKELEQQRTPRKKNAKKEEEKE